MGLFKRDYFSKIVGIIMVLVIFFLSCVSIAEFFIYKSLVSKEMNDNFELISNGIKADMDRTLDTLSSLSEYIYINDAVAGNIFSYDAEETDIYADIRDVYNAAMTAIDKIDSLQFYNAYTKRMYFIGAPATGGDSELENILKSSDKITSNVLIMRNMDYVVNMKTSKKTIFSYFVYGGTKITENTSFLVVNLKSDYLMDCLEKYSAGGGDNMFFVYNEKENFYLYDNKNLKGSGKDIITAVKNGKRTVKIGGKRKVIYSTVLQPSDITVCSITPYSEVYGRFYKYMAAMLLIVLMIGVLAIYFSYFAARRIYKPFGKLYGEIRSDNSAGDEFENIKQIFTEYKHSISKYKNMYDYQSDMMANYYISRLLKNSAELSEKEMNRIFSALSISRDLYFAVVVLCIDDAEEKAYYDDALMKYGLYNISMEVIRRRYSAEGTQTAGGVEIIVNVTDTDFENKMCSLLKEIQKNMTHHFGMTVTASVSPCVQDAEEISYIEFETVKNLAYRFNYGYGRIFTENFLSDNKQSGITRFSPALEELLLGCTDADRASEILGKIIDEIRRMNYMNAFAECTRLSGLLCEKFNIEVELFDEFIDGSFRTGQTLADFYNSSVEKLGAALAKGEKSSRIELETNRMIRLVEEYVVKNFANSGACIGEAAEEIGVSKRKLSETFTKTKNMSFVSYLTKFRIDKAKEYLLSDRYSIKEISKMVGIENDTYFYKIFKRDIGVTPMEYRINHSK